MGKEQHVSENLLREPLLCTAKQHYCATTNTHGRVANAYFDVVKNTRVVIVGVLHDDDEPGRYYITHVVENRVAKSWFSERELESFFGLRIVLDVGTASLVVEHEV